MRTLLPAALLALVIAGPDPAAALANDESEKLLQQVNKALKDKDYPKAIELARKAIAADPKHAEAHDRLGDALLKAGKFPEAVAAFDAFLKLKPDFAPEHWRRGIALYYAGKFKEGKEQFDLHRTVNPEDVENSAWHYLCNARATSPKQARKDLIPVSKDARVPMKQVLQLFAGELKPQDVIDAAEKSGLAGEKLTSARFYAHLYVALYHEAEGDKDKTRDHLTTAVEKYKIGDYMWDVAAVHLELMKKR
jgi:lipoprotein NlpI